LLKFEDRTLPIPYLVYEAIYAPQPNTTYPNYTPAETRLRFGAPAQYELSLYDHLKAQSSVSCQLPTARGTCIPKTVVVNVVPFDPAVRVCRPPCPTSRNAIRALHAKLNPLESD